MPLEVWAAVLFVGLGAALGLLHPLAMMLRNETQLHDLRLRVAQLREVQLKRLRALAEVTLDAKAVSPSKHPAP